MYFILFAYKSQPRTGHTFISAIIVNGGSHTPTPSVRAPGKLGRVFDLNCCSSELHKQPGERDNPVPAKAVKLDQAHIAVGGREHISLSVGKADAHLTRINRAIGRRKIRASRWNYIGMRIKQFRDSLESET